ncbi:MAG: LysR family transcriptional regulator [Neomegalonema sp.]|nr:LysR family transcriptional regulator [Neomegalonema sp.]
MKRLDQITLKQLRALHTIVDEGTIAAAAERLGLTGPAVHNQLKLLEDSIGSPLLQREGRERNMPTPQGAALLVAYADARASLERAITVIDALNEGKSGSVILGVVSTAKYFAPKIVAELRAQMPEITINLRIGNRATTIGALARGEYDLCIMGRPPREPLIPATSLCQHPHVIIAAADHPLAHQRQVCAQDLIKERFVLREPGSGTRILTTRFLDDLAEGYEVETVEMASNETIKQAVLCGLGVALISAHTVADEIRTGRLVTLCTEGVPIYRQWYLLSHPDLQRSPGAERVRDWILTHTDRFIPKLDLG